MKNGNAWKTLGVSITVLLFVVGCILGGWRADMTNAQRERSDINTAVVTQGNRITALETRYENIDDSLVEIKTILKEK